VIFQTKHKGTKQLSTVRLTLRPFAPQDAESCLHNWAADEEIYRYLSALPQTADELREWFGYPPQTRPTPTRAPIIGRLKKRTAAKWLANSL